MYGVATRGLYSALSKAGLMCVVAVLEVDLMNAVQVPLPESQGVDYTAGIDRYPAFAFSAASNVQLPAEQIFHPQLW